MAKTLKYKIEDRFAHFDLKSTKNIGDIGHHMYVSIYLLAVIWMNHFLESSSHCCE